jgi:hypothetical protein
MVRTYRGLEAVKNPAAMVTVDRRYRRLTRRGERQGLPPGTFPVATCRQVLAGHKKGDTSEYVVTSFASE